VTTTTSEGTGDGAPDVPEGGSVEIPRPMGAPFFTSDPARSTSRSGSPTKSNRRALGELAAVVVVAAVVARFTGLGDIMLVIACIVVMIMVHELGHLLAAKHGGMKVTEYFLGFGPRLWSITRGETEYGIKLLPLGGYVKIPGMTNLEVVDPADEARTYRQQPFHARLLVAVAGSAMHFLMAFVLLWGLLCLVGTTDNSRISIQSTLPVAGQSGPAAKAGLLAGDVIVSVDGHRIGSNADLLLGAIQDHPDQPTTWVVERGGRTVTLRVVPVNGRTLHESGVDAPAGSAPYGIVGVGLGSPTVTRSPGAALVGAGREFTHVAWASVAGIGHLFAPQAVTQRFDQVTSAKAANQAATNGTRVESIVGAVRTAGQAAHASVADLVLILVSLNIFIGIFNLFPMLPLDGGHVAIAVYEKIRTGRRKVAYHADVTRLMPFTWLMVAFLGVLFVTSLLTDILHPMANPFN